MSSSGHTHEQPAERGEPRVYRVREINYLVHCALDERFGRVRVEGELSGFRPHASGHCYFTLREPRAELSCAMFRSAIARLGFTPRDGETVVASGRLSIYMDRGRYQLMVDRMWRAGEGTLQARLEELKRRLAAEGLFDDARKRPLPVVPRVVGLVTSPSGAALSDLVRVATARWPGVRLLLAPARVQGEGAAASIARAIGSQVRHGRADVIIVGRGGGSVEDLWAFNEEIVVRAIAGASVPIVSAVGHETDVTLADLAADVRAATPSRAAELVVPDRNALVRDVEGRRTRLSLAIERRLARDRERVERLAKSHGLNRPRAVLAQSAQRLDDLAHRLALAFGGQVPARRAHVVGLGRRLVAAVERPIARARLDVSRQAGGLRAAAGTLTASRRARLAALDAGLSALSPLRVLERGYAIATGPDGTLVRDATSLAPGDEISVRVHRGGVRARVTDAHPADGAGTASDSGDEKNGDRR